MALSGWNISMSKHEMRCLTWIGFAFILLTLVCDSVVSGAEGGTETRSTRRITVVFNNVPHRPDLTTAWGFAAVIETPAQTVLFDTGGDGVKLLSNMVRLGIEPGQIALVVLSHIHADHSGGLDAFLARNSHVTVAVPESFPASFNMSVRARGARLQMVGGPTRLSGPFYSTGEMGSVIKEQALIVDAAKGLVVVTGCAHPNVVAMARAAREYLAKDIYLLMGGFHLLGMKEREILSVITELKALKITKVAPSHCTGEKATALLRAAWGGNFVDGGLGAVIDLP
jgi:7,8-dihydropterin-6-yl-methyl-4-(beta-D-ribofuranosyl)aminobenzene 5'-phosphate synthase